MNLNTMPANTSIWFQLVHVTIFARYWISDASLRFIVRDFVYNEEELNAGKNEITKLATDKKKQFVSYPFITFSSFFSTTCSSPENSYIV